MLSGDCDDGSSDLGALCGCKVVDIGALEEGKGSLLTVEMASLQSKTISRKTDPVLS